MVRPEWGYKMSRDGAHTKGPADSDLIGAVIPKNIQNIIVFTRSGFLKRLPDFINGTCQISVHHLCECFPPHTQCAKKSRNNESLAFVIRPTKGCLEQSLIYLADKQKRPSKLANSNC